MPVRRAASGFSLVEMIAALLIFSVGVLSVMEVIVTCLRSTASSLGHARAVCLAQQLVEEAIAEGELELTSDSGEFKDEFTTYAWQREVEDADQTGLRELQLTVTWIERGREKRFTLTTLVAERQ